MSTTKTSATGRSGRPGRPPGGVSKADQLAATLREQILSGQLSPAALLPSERQMIEHYGVSRITVRAAIAALRAEGLVQTIPGKGAFVRRPSDRPLHTHQRTITVDDDGNFTDNETGNGEFREAEPPSTYHRNADATLALAIGVPEHTPLFGSDRLLENAAGTRIFVQTYVPFSTALEIPALEENPFVSAGQVYKAACDAGLSPDFSDYITARNPTPDDARTLRIPDGIPMLVTRRLATHNGRPLIMQETHRSAENTQLHYQPGQ
ncbi:GntR family transcriptional regulator [Kribbella qitaiheensis]|uniref:GntR family transcriptional regulator n=1 Tax=Kribbella qitaiheensis TaxID=1544730 RepID=A0A7G6WY12_9ACTN|nr:GntR family transcriptional regulator [Kribbella qitaiheensis]QNE18877.1 GntR family transcriptional regulator [Kribbella qitaiheensis]